MEFRDIRELGDRVVGLGRVRSVGKKSGVETESQFAFVVDFKNGKAMCIRSYLYHEQGARSRRAVGVRVPTMEALVLAPLDDGALEQVKLAEAGGRVRRRFQTGARRHARARQGAALSSAGGDSLRIRLLTLEGRRIADARREDAQRVHG